MLDMQNVSNIGDKYGRVYVAKIYSPTEKDDAPWYVHVLLVNEEQVIILSDTVDERGNIKRKVPATYPFENLNIKDLLVELTEATPYTGVRYENINDMLGALTDRPIYGWCESRGVNVLFEPVPPPSIFEPIYVCTVRGSVIDNIASRQIYKYPDSNRVRLVDNGTEEILEIDACDLINYL